MRSMTDDRAYRIRRNLTDAGCDTIMIEQFLELERRQRREEQYRLLSRYKAELLEALHRDAYKIDCLDHMVYTMQKEDQT